MTYTFAHITHLNQVLEAIKGRDEFVVKTDEENDLSIINYLVNFEDTFPPVTDERTAILRECRGITFQTSTGKILARKYHKFFNIGERPETQVQAIDWESPYYRFEKLDGSMITPLLINGKVRWCTKMGLTDVAKPVDAWTADKPEYHEMASYWMGAGYTPIFEWCSREQRIVIDYPVTRLVLTAIRHNETGAYLSYAEMKEECKTYGIPVARATGPYYGLEDDLLEEIRALEGAEGDVFRWNDGMMQKCKGEWYCQIHKTMEHLNHEKDVIRLILDERLDDAKPFLPEDLVDAADRFGRDIFAGLKAKASDIYWNVQADFDNLNGSKKKFAEKNLSNSATQAEKTTGKIKFWMWDNLGTGTEEEDLYKYLVQMALQHTSTQTKVNDIRFIWGGHTWHTYRDASNEE